MSGVPQIAIRLRLRFAIAETAKDLKSLMKKQKKTFSRVFFVARQATLSIEQTLLGYSQIVIIS